MKDSGKRHICAAQETFDSVALSIYGHERYAADLMDANPEYCGGVVFSGGETLRLPVIDVPRNEDEAALANTIAPWK